MQLKKTRKLKQPNKSNNPQISNEINYVARRFPPLRHILFTVDTIYNDTYLW